MAGFNWRHIFFQVTIVASAAVVALSPLLFLLWALNTYAEQRANEAMQDITIRMVSDADSVFNEAADALAAVAPLLRHGCDDAKARMSEIVAEATYLRDLVVRGPAGDVICATSTTAANAIPSPKFLFAKTHALSIGFSETSKGAPPLVQLRREDSINTLYAFVNPQSLSLNVLPNDWHNVGKGALFFTDNRKLVDIEAQNNLPFSEQGAIFNAVTSSQRFPIKAEILIPRTAAMAPYKAVSLLIGVGGSMLALMLIVFVLQAVRRRPQAEDALMIGIRNHEFVPYYQPVVDLQTGALLGCEVLIRWLRRDGTIVPPGAFIQLAEESGLAVEMTRQLMALVRDGVGQAYAERPKLKVAFNLFAAHFSDLSTVDDVREIFKTGGVRYTQLVMEVTERYPLPSLNRARVAIGALQDLGCRVALDDAGTGHGGLAYLQKLGMDQVKIDKLFVDTITEGVNSAPIIDSLIEMARQMNMEIVAEGVETVIQCEYLKQRGVSAAQGYLFAKPMPQQDYIRFIETMAPLEGRGDIVYLDVA